MGVGRVASRGDGVDVGGGVGQVLLDLADAFAPVLAVGLVLGALVGVDARAVRRAPDRRATLDMNATDLAGA